MIDLSTRLRQHWFHTVALRAGATDAEVAAFEARHRVRLPADMREYLPPVNGMDASDTDKDCTSFWGLDRITPAMQYHRSGRGSLPEDEFRSMMQK